jgi:protoporphyrinogen/coproporphyrinogen III oxidase
MQASRPSVALIGAGITGLTAAFRLQRAGIPVVLHEASDRAGGAIRSVRQGGYLAEEGPNTILETSPLIADLVREAGLEARVLRPDPDSEARFLVRGGRPVALPSSPFGFLTTPLFTPSAKLAILREPFLPRRTDNTEESVAQFVTRRLGREFLDRTVDAMVAGIYAGDPEKLSVTQAFPKLAALEERYGSLIRGQMLGARDRRKSGEVAKDRAPKLSFDEGLEVLPSTLAAKLGEAPRLKSRVASVTRSDAGWILRTEEGHEEHHAAIIHAGTAHGLAALRLLEREAPVDLFGFSEIRHPPVASVVLGFRREDVAFPCRGFGVLVPGIEKLRILGTIFSSSLFPNRAPAGHLTLTTYVGGERHPELALLPEEELIKTVCKDLERLLGVRGKPTFRHVTLWRKAIPQYNLGFGRQREAMTKLEERLPGLHLAGHYRDGISLADSIVSGWKIAERVEKSLRSGHASSP